MPETGHGDKLAGVTYETCRIDLRFPLYEGTFYENPRAERGPNVTLKRPKPG
jgi:hypothetical protein